MAGLDQPSGSQELSKHGTCVRCENVRSCRQCFKLYCSEECKSLDYENHKQKCGQYLGPYAGSFLIPPKGFRNTSRKSSQASSCDSLNMEQLALTSNEQCVVPENQMSTASSKLAEENSSSTRNAQGVIPKKRYSLPDTKLGAQKSDGLRKKKSSSKSKDSSDTPDASTATLINEIIEFSARFSGRNNNIRDVICMHKESENRYWVLNVEDLVKLYEIQENLIREGDNYKDIHPQPGLLCGCFVEKEWYRGKIVSVSSKPTAHFIDFGNTSECGVLFKELPDRFLRLPGLAFLIQHDGDTEGVNKVNKWFSRKITVEETGKTSDGVLCVRVIASDPDEYEPRRFRSKLAQELFDPPKDLLEQNKEPPEPRRIRFEHRREQSEPRKAQSEEKKEQPEPRRAQSEQRKPQPEPEEEEKTEPGKGQSKSGTTFQSKFTRLFFREPRAAQPSTSEPKPFFSRLFTPKKQKSTKPKGSKEKSPEPDFSDTEKPSPDVSQRKKK